MRLAGNIKGLIKSLHDTTSKELDERVLKDVLKALGESKVIKSAVSEPNIWREIMKSKITKFAAALVIITGAILALNNGTVSITTSTFAQMTEAMKRVPWIHIVVKGSYRGKPVEIEQWYGYEMQVVVIKESDGKVRYFDYDKDKRYNYDRELNTITISHGDVGDFPQSVPYWENWLEQISTHQNNVEILHHMSEFDGKEVKIYRLVWAERDNINVEWEMTVDGKSDLPLLGQARATEANCTVVWDGEIYFEYPKEGPVTIYDVGVPRSTKAPSALVEEIWDLYRTHRENAPSRYIAVEANPRRPRDYVDWVNVFYMNGNLWREESRSASSLQKDWAEILNQKEISFGPVLELAKQGGERYGWIKLYDGEKLYTIQSDNGGPWEIRSDNVYKFKKSDRNDTLVRLGWPRLNLWRSNIVQAEVVNTDYSGKHNLICIELLLDGRQYEDGKFELPAREMFYLNPELDYICQKHEHHAVPDAEWQEDNSWREGIEPGEIHLRANSFIDEITNFGKTANGKWYPVVIEKSIASHRPDTGEFVPLRLNSITHIWLESEPDFPDDIFEPDNLPKANE